MTRSSRAWAVAFALLCLATPLVAQTTGRIQGTVTDNSGAAVPGVAVTASSPSLQGVQSTTTDNKGEFRFASVPPGTYCGQGRDRGLQDGEPERRRRRDRPHGLAHLQARGRGAVRDRERHRRVARHRRHELDDRRQRHLRHVQPPASPARHLRDRARRPGHAGRRRRSGGLRLHAAPRTTTSSRASTRPGIRYGRPTPRRSTSTSSRRSRSRPAASRPSTAA